jgi:hypothetical protein
LGVCARGGGDNDNRFRLCRSWVSKLRWVPTGSGCVRLAPATPNRFADWSAKEVDTLNSLALLSAKPAVYLINLSEKDYIRKKSKWLPKVHEWVQVPSTCSHTACASGGHGKTEGPQVASGGHGKTTWQNCRSASGFRRPWQNRRSTSRCSRALPLSVLPA